jgi:hypothetical protein
VRRAICQSAGISPSVYEAIRKLDVVSEWEEEIWHLVCGPERVVNDRLQFLEPIVWAVFEVARESSVPSSLYRREEKEASSE